MMKCKQCGEENGDAKRTCSRCGAFLEGYTLNNVTEQGFVLMSREQMQRIAEQVRTDRLRPTSETAWQIQRDDIRLASCHDCPHWQDGDEGPQCEYPDCPPCNGN